jgi:hypothetical protein
MLGWAKGAGKWESPVGEWHNLDIIAKRPDRRVDLLIVVARPLDLSDKVVDVLARKFRNYCQYVKSADFAQEFGPPSRDRVGIGLRSDWEVPNELIDLIAEIGQEEETPAEIAVFYEDPR